jgi:hypothetical protein
MQEAAVYEQVLQKIMQAGASAIIIVNRADEITYCCLGKGKKTAMAGKRLPKLARLIWGSETSDNLMDEIKKVRSSDSVYRISKIGGVSKKGIEYHLSINISLLDEQRVLLFIQDITEAVLLEQEFSTLLDESEKTINELQGSVARLEMQLMEL